MVTVSEGATARGRRAWCCPARRTRTGTASSAGSASSSAKRSRSAPATTSSTSRSRYLMRSGSPDSLDLMVATNYAVMAADLALEGAIRPHGRAAERLVHDRSDHGDRARASSASTSTSSTTPREYRPKVRHVPGSRCSCTEPTMSTFGVLTAGGDCPGLNAAIRAVVVAASIATGTTVVGVRQRLATGCWRPTFARSTATPCAGSSSAAGRSSARRG